MNIKKRVERLEASSGSKWEVFIYDKVYETSEEGRILVGCKVNGEEFRRDPSIPEREFLDRVEKEMKERAGVAFVGFFPSAI